MIDAHILMTEAKHFKNLHLQESRLSRRYGQDAKELKELQARRKKEQEEKEQAQAEFERDNKAYHERVDRFLALQQEFRELRNVRVVANTLVWDDGYPLGGDDRERNDADSAPFVPRSVVANPWFEWGDDRPLRCGPFEIHSLALGKHRRGAVAVQVSAGRRCEAVVRSLEELVSR